jgi:hypothetical protein
LRLVVNPLMLASFALDVAAVARSAPLLQLLHTRLDLANAGELTKLVHLQSLVSPAGRYCCQHLCMHVLNMRAAATLLCPPLIEYLSTHALGVRVRVGGACWRG